MSLMRWISYLYRRLLSSRIRGIIIAIVLLPNLLIFIFVFDNSSVNMRMSPVAEELLVQDACANSEVQLALVVGSVIEARDAATAIKTIVHHQRLAPLQLHIFVTRLTHHIMRTLLSTWPLSQVNYLLYEVPYPTVNSTGRWSPTTLRLPSLLTLTVDKVLFVDVKLRLVDDIGILWQSVTNSLNTDSAVGLVSHPDCKEPSVQCWKFHLVALDLKAMREWAETEILSNLHSQSELNSWLSTHADTIFPIDCSWAIELKAEFNSSACLNSNSVQGILWSIGISSTSWHPGVEAAVESIHIIANSEPPNRQPSSSPPLHTACPRPSTIEQPSGWFSSLSNSSCAHFRYVAGLVRRVHPFFFGADVKTTGSTDVTLATQLTVDRLRTLDRVLTNWRGPASVALHIGDAELEAATNLIRSSSRLSRSNVAIHMVYRRLAYNPINYLRNVAINNSRTPYTFYVDVDLVPNPGLYDSLRRRLPQLHDANRQNIAFIVPSFEAFTDLPKFPQNKTELLSLMAEDKVGGYSMKNGWNLGHRPTKFDHWVKANEPYDVQYRNAFEPYLVVPTDTEPRFDQRLLERMADKAIYCRSLHGAGFILRVLPDVFVIHLPHPQSPGLRQWARVPGYGRCASIISDESKAELRRRYPNVTF